MQENCWPHLTATQLFPFMLMSPEFRPICDRFHKLHQFSTSSHAVSYLRSAEFLLCLCSAKARPVGEDKMPVTAALSSTYVEPDVKIQTTADTDSDDADSDTSSLQPPSVSVLTDRAATVTTTVSSKVTAPVHTSKPNQPPSIDCPTVVISEVHRSFKADWFDGDGQEGNVKCHTCRMAANLGLLTFSKSVDHAFTESGFENWKKATDTTIRYSRFTCAQKLTRWPA